MNVLKGTLYSNAVKAILKIISIDYSVILDITLVLLNTSRFYLWRYLSNSQEM